MFKITRLIRPLFLLSLISLTLSPLAWTAELSPVTLQLKWKHQFQFAGYYAAKAKGFYQAAGLDVTIVEADTGVDAIQEVVSGRAQFAVGTSEVMLSRYHGNPVIVLGVIFQHSPLSLITLANSGLDNIHKLAGRKVMIETGSSELFAYLYQEGFTKKAFQLQPHSLEIADLLSGQIDAMSVYITDEVFLLYQQQQTFNQFSPRMSGIDFYGDNFFTLESELQEQPERVRAFREASLRGWRYAMQHQDEIIQLIYSQYSQRHSIEHLRFEANAMRELMQPDLIDPGYMNTGRWQHIAQTYAQLGLLPENFDVMPMLYFPNGKHDLERLEIRLYYTAAGLTGLALLSIVLFHFYRSARINAFRLKTMFDFAPLSLVVLDHQLRIQSWNAEAEKTFLWQERDMLGKSITAIIPLEERSSVNQVLNAVLNERRVVRHENKNIKQDGTEILCEWLNAPFKGQNDRRNFIICMARDITEQKKLTQQLEQAAHYDSLTSLPNRALILHELKLSLAIAMRQKTKVGLLFLDLNGFKAINDRLGHEAGDILLTIIAHRVLKALRETDSVGRLGGDEFLVVLQSINSRVNAEKIAEQLQALISEPCVIKNQTITISTSVGISLYPDDATDINQLIHIADQRMYQHKSSST